MLSSWLRYFFSCLLALPVFGFSQVAKQPADTSSELPGIVVSASRGKEKILKAPVSIEKMEVRDIRQSAKPSFFDAIENLKGVQMITPSLGFRVINARGFTNTTNVRFVQMVDGMDIQAPHIGAPMGNALGPGDLDIAAVEIIPGSSSALYGMNAINGTANFITKDAFSSQGLSFSQKTGVNHLSDEEHSPAIFSETAIRWDQSWKNRLAVKVNAVYTNGLDWYADNSTDLNPAANKSTGLFGVQNPGSDLVNRYADESSNRRTIVLEGKQYIVSRTGYREKDMSSYQLKNFKADGTLAYQFNKGLVISYTYRVAQTNTLYQRTNRFRLNDYITSQHAISLRSPSIQFRAYVNRENTGDSYNIRSMAENVDRSYKTDDQWYRDFSSNYTTSSGSGASLPERLQSARSFADRGRPEPHTLQADALVRKLGDINDWNVGAALRVRSSMYHAEFQHDITKLIFPESRQQNFSLMYGIDFRNYVVIPDGNYFINPVKSGANLTYRKIGGFVQATEYLFDRKLKLNGVLRIDKNQYFAPRLNPRFAFVYSPVERHNFRIALQQGYRFPSLFEAFSNINSGGVKRVGGLPVMSNGIFENSYLRASIDAFQAANTLDVNTNNLSLSQAINKNRNLLKKNNYTYLEPEKVKGVETGYRGNFFKGRLTIDADFYYNVYYNLMAQVEANIPKAGAPDSLAFFLNDKSKQDRYRLWTNSHTISYNFGSTLGVSWNLPRSFFIGGNLTLSKLQRKDSNDGLEDGFNTPSWMYNINFGNPELWKKLGYQINFRWQSRYLWQSSLATGMVDAFHTVDAQVQYSTRSNSINIKLGATNLFNRYYYSFIGGPSVGGFFYCTTTLNLK